MQIEYTPYNYNPLGNVSEKVVARAGRIRPLKKVLEAQLFSKHCDRYSCYQLEDSPGLRIYEKD